MNKGEINKNPYSNQSGKNIAGITEYLSMSLNVNDFNSK
jgi:hypothetical protein